MSADHKSSAPRFTLANVIWQCWVVDDGQAYEWRSSCGRFTVRRNVRLFAAREGERILGKQFQTIRAAMEAAQFRGTVSV